MTDSSRTSPEEKSAKLGAASDVGRMTAHPSQQTSVDRIGTAASCHNREANKFIRVCGLHRFIIGYEDNGVCFGDDTSSPFAGSQN